LRGSDSKRQTSFSSIRQGDHGLSANGKIDRRIGWIAGLLATVIHLPAYGAARVDYAAKPRIKGLAVERGIEIVHVGSASSRDDLGFPFFAIAGRRHAGNGSDSGGEDDYTGQESLHLIRRLRPNVMLCGGPAQCLKMVRCFWPVRTR
jgi:hypothetical protein